MEKVRYVKANYTPLEDITPLPRNVVTQAIEPVPDHKLVVELAGQWQGNWAHFQLAKTEKQAKKITRAVADVKNGHRTLATFQGLENEPKNLYLVSPLRGMPNPLTFLLAENLMPVEKEAEMDEWDTVLIPVRALAYLDGSKDKNKAAELKGGYLYVFWKGKLWRELKVNKSGYYQDIDTEYYRARDKQERQNQHPVIEHREADGFDIPQFWVPYKIAGEVQEGANGVKVMFSPEQKTFQQIESLESDAAKLDSVATPLDELSVYSKGKAFQSQEHTADIQSAQLHSVMEGEDMSWLSHQCSVFEQFSPSNTAVAYVDGHNKGFTITLERGLADENIACVEELYAILKDQKSGWQQAVLLEELEDGCGHFVRGLFSGLPLDGEFSLFIATPCDPFSGQCVFAHRSFQEIMEPKRLEPISPAPENEAINEDEIKAKEENKFNLMEMWKKEALGIE
ncbi:hypothetical protein L4174_017120 [Photobacterium sp. CCB-ST2H9]|uniref:hypothetical protein n=1 Tax=Photobacterium sp. CCB-ST2H9 TaxID=2912855 RepID=UPI002005EC3E|nr:hypothetical protein [Photobacterium sp. CCB-ST2H9]UTM59793.1 hypothetical protein L4174_017120 [Photobacterium sp. CCB-ST2H9]